MPRPSFPTSAALLCRAGSQPHRLSHAPQNRPHIADQPTTRPASPAMCQPPLTHNRAKRPTTPQCVSHHSHIAAQRIFPNDNNRRKQPIPHPHHQPSTPPTPQCARRHSHVAEQPANLIGTWKQTNSNSTDMWMEAEITADTITIQWVSDDGDTKSLYWKGTYTAPDKAGDWKWTRQGNTTAMQASLLGSQARTCHGVYYCAAPRCSCVGSF